MISPSPPLDEPPVQATLGRNSAFVGLAIGCSRILGLVREVIFAALFGAGLAKDAFDVAFRIPNILRDLFAEGAMSTAFVTTFSAAKAQDGDQRAFEIARRVMTLLMAVVGVVVLIGCLLSADIIELYASGFAGIEGKTQMTTVLMQIMFPFLLLVSVSSVLMGICNAFGSFGRPALAPAMFNVGTIVGGTSCAFWFDSMDIEMIYGMGIGTLIGGFLQWVLLVPQARKHGYKFKFDLKPADPGVRKVLALMGPALIGLSAVQINILITTGFASQLENGSISWLSYAFRLMQLPIGIFGVAIATAALPNLAELAAKSKTAELARALSEATRLCLFLTLPAAIGLWVLSDEIIRAIYRWMEFTEFDVQMTADALKYYAIGLVSYGLVKVFAPAFYANSQSRVPVIGTVIAIATNIGLCWYLISDWKHVGLAGATSISACVNLAVLLIANSFTRWSLLWSPVIWAAIKISISGMLMGIVVNTSSNYIAEKLGTENQLINIMTLIAVILTGMLTYLLCCRVMKLEEVIHLKKKLRS